MSGGSILMTPFMNEVLEIDGDEYLVVEDDQKNNVPRTFELEHEIGMYLGLYIKDLPAFLSSCWPTSPWNPPILRKILDQKLARLKKT